MKINWSTLRISFLLSSIAILLSACGDENPCKTPDFRPSEEFVEGFGNDAAAAQSNGALSGERVPLSSGTGNCSDLGVSESLISARDENGGDGTNDEDEGPDNEEFR